MDTFITDLKTGLALHLDTHDVGTWRDDTAYAPGETAIVFDTLPEAPDRVIVLALYGVTDDVTGGDDVIGLQVRTRWEGQDTGPVDGLTGDVFNTLHSLHDVNLPVRTGVSVHITQCLRQSQTSGGIDKNHRWTRIQNFYLTVWRPSPLRP